MKCTRIKLQHLISLKILFIETNQNSITKEMLVLHIDYLYRLYKGHKPQLIIIQQHEATYLRAALLESLLHPNGDEF
jgi:hypothetical protein